MGALHVINATEQREVSLDDIDRAKIVITNYHAFKLRERISVSKGTRTALEGWRGDKLQTVETEGQMLQRIMPELMGMKNVIVLNDEAHHCYRERVKDATGETEADLKGEDKDEAKANNEAARMWITGLEIVKRKLGVPLVYDLSATPFFLRGSGYAEGTLFPWTMCDFSLMDAIECGIVKLPRVPVADNVPGGDTPMSRNLWEHIGKKMPKKGRGATGRALDPLNLPLELVNALDALYGHYEKTFELWQGAGIRVPPVFIIVCNNTSTSELIYKYVSGFHRENDAGSSTLQNGHLALFRNYDEHGNRIPRPNTILIDSARSRRRSRMPGSDHSTPDWRPTMAVSVYTADLFGSPADVALPALASDNLFSKPRKLSFPRSPKAAAVRWSPWPNSTLPTSPSSSTPRPPGRLCPVRTVGAQPGD